MTSNRGVESVLALALVVVLVAPVAAMPLEAGGEETSVEWRSSSDVQRPGAGGIDAVKERLADRTRLLTAAPMAMGAPNISNFTVTNPSGFNVSISFDSSENLSEILVTIEKNGQVTEGLGGDDFSRSGTGTYTYSSTYQAGEDAEFNATLVTAEDSDGNDGANSESGSTIVDTTPPTISGISNTTKAAISEPLPLSWARKEASIFTRPWSPWPISAFCC